MDLSLALKLVDFIHSMDVKTIVFVGGEPTMYPWLGQLIKYISKKNIETILVTNGIKLYNKNYLLYLIKSGLSKINISVKGNNKNVYSCIGSADGYDMTIKGITNTKETGVSFVCSFLFDRNTIQEIEKTIELLYKLSNTTVKISFCRNSFDENGIIKSESVLANSEYIRIFSEKYEEINKRVDGNIMVSNKFPLCEWDQGQLMKMREEGQFVTECMLVDRNGLVFDEYGRLLMCNFLHNFPIGCFGEDFYDKRSFNNFWYSAKINDLYFKIGEAPFLRCGECKDAHRCKGGCPLLNF